MNCFLEITINNDQQYTFRTNESLKNNNVHVYFLAILKLCLVFSGKTLRRVSNTNVSTKTCRQNSWKLGCTNLTKKSIKARLNRSIK